MILFAAFDWHQFFFVLFALLTCVFAAGVLFATNIVRMAFYLVISLGASSGLFFLAGAEFVGAMQLMIYVGGTLVLLIFGVMLTAQARFISMKTRSGEWVMAMIIGGALLFLLLIAAFRIEDWSTANPSRGDLTVQDTETTAQLGASLSVGRPDRLENPESPLSDGLSVYLLPFVIISVHLLVVLIGAAYMARAKRRAPRAAN